MAVAWYGAKVWLLTSPDGSERIIATKPTHSWTWEMWTVDKRDGTTAKVPQRLQPKYAGVPISAAYDKEYDGENEETIPTVALLRVEYPDGTEPPLELTDVISLLNTQAKWETAMTQYPTLKYKFADQPYYPAT